VLRTTFIAGFPGETEAEFEYLLDFLREAQLDRVGCFAYSPVDGAVANALDGAVPEPVREERRARFMQVQEAISLDRLKRKIGSRQRVLVDAVTPQGAVARSSADAPEIDGLVYVAPDPRLKTGEFFDVRIESSDAHDLRAVLL
jgi:ribosomal protein S12 methylthiotransferase